MTVREIVEAHLKREGYDGLYSDRFGCGCEVGDLIPCDFDAVGDCEPGHKRPCHEDCEYGGDCDWHIAPERRHLRAKADASEQEGA